MLANLLSAACRPFSLSFCTHILNNIQMELNAICWLSGSRGQANGMLLLWRLPTARFQPSATNFDYADHNQCARATGVAG